jgi:hypothetical protein
VLLTGAIAPLILTLLLALFLPESVKFLVQRGKDVMQIRRIASRFPQHAGERHGLFPGGGESRL